MQKAVLRVALACVREKSPETAMVKINRDRLRERADRWTTKGLMKLLEFGQGSLDWSSIASWFSRVTGRNDTEPCSQRYVYVARELRASRME